MSDNSLGSVQSTSVVRRSLLGCIAVASIAVIWLGVLPRLGEQREVRQHIETLQAANVEASAMFYTELNWSPPTGPVWRASPTTEAAPST